MATKRQGRLARPGRPLFDLYEQYIGEPQSRKDVYGYWTFLAGFALGLIGVAVYLLAITPGEQQFFVREISITLSAIGLALALFGFGLMLPVRRRGIYLSVLGLLVALGAVGAFVMGYPGRWITGSDYSGTVILAYTVGVGTVAGVAALVPVLTGEKGWLVEDLDEQAGHPPVLVGESLHGTLYTVYKVGTGRWTWRVLQQDAVGENAVGPHSRPDVEPAVEEARALIGDAGLLEITTAAFRLYESDAGEWRWKLMRDDGTAVAVSAGVHPDRDAAETAASLLKEEGPNAPVVEVRGAAFDVYEADGRWQWRLLDEQRQPLATSPAGFPDSSAAEAAIEPVRTKFDGARVIALEELGVELFETDGAWRWQVIDATDDVLLTSSRRFDSRRAAESAADGMKPAVGSAPVLESDRSAFELYDAPEGWQFRLVDADGDRLADSARAFVDESAARREAQRLVDTASDADIIQYEGASFECYPDDGQWHWRLVTDDRELVASSGEGYPDEEAAEDALEAVRDRALAADLIEFEHAAFQQYESEGRWRWRLIDADGAVLADSGDDYESRDEVGDAMKTLKDRAPDADILEIETAAFELFEDASGWGWRLIDETGALVAQGADRHDVRAGAERAMETLVHHADDAEVRGMAGPAFQFYTDDEDAWRWRYVHPDGLVAASGADAHATRDELVNAVAAVREQASSAAIHAIDPLAFELLDGGRTNFRLIDADREVVADGPRRYDDHGSLDADVSRLKDHVPDATVFAIGDGAIRLTPADGAWSWELVDAERRTLASAPGTYAERADAEDAAERARTLAPEGELIDFDAVAFELYRDDGELRWRLIDDGGTAVAAAADGFATPADARAGVEDVKSLVPDASVLDIDEPGFELHRDADGWSWRLVDTHGTTLVRSLEPLESRAAAREAVKEVRTYAPDGRITVVE
jgi:uncharacterized protein YegP (UPF0339 family)